MEGKTIFEVVGIGKRFFGIRALNDVSLAIRPGTVLGLVGENGAGKSTLMNIASGVVAPDEGSMVLEGRPYRPRDPNEASRAGIGFIHQELNLFTNLSIAENIFIESFPRGRRLPFIDQRRLAESTRSLLASLDMHFSPSTKVESLAPGERQLVEIAKALSYDSRILIFDEPTTSLTAKETEGLFALIRRLRLQGKAIVYISHILGDVSAIADDIAVLRDGELVASGPVAGFPVDRMIPLMIGKDFAHIFPEKTSRPSTEKILRIEGLSQPGIVRDISIEVHKGEVVGVFGLMGSGRTETARMIFGLDQYESGAVFMGDSIVPHKDPVAAIRLGMAFVTENRREEGLLMNLSISDNMGLVSLGKFLRRIGGVVHRRRLHEAVRKVGAELRIKCGSYEMQNAKSLSGGNQQKVVIGKWLMSRPRALIMDEPTRGIDVGSKYEVYSLMNDLASRGTGILFISSEIEELIGICDRIIVMSRGEIIMVFPREGFNREHIMRAAFRQAIADRAQALTLS
jgi:ribose transport system ATP-binding protein